MQVIISLAYSVMTPKEIATQLEKFRTDNGLSRQAFAKKADVGQGQASKILRGLFADTTAANVVKLCKYAGIDLDVHTISPAEYEPLMNALSEVWPETERRRMALVKVIKSLKGLS